jgi:hypothetical protein
MNDEIVEIVKKLLSDDPIDVYNKQEDVKISSIELVESRPVDEELSREIGSANLFLASAFLATVIGIDLPTKNSEELTKSKEAWTAMVFRLKSENFIRQRPDSLRESFKVV